jgi:hypothetical protein
MGAVAARTIAISVDEDADELLAAAANVVGVNRIRSTRVRHVQIRVMRERRPCVHGQGRGEHGAGEPKPEGQSHRRLSRLSIHSEIPHHFPLRGGRFRRGLSTCVVKKNGHR